MKIPILSYVKNLIEQISLPTKADRLNPEKLSDLLNRLRRYDSPTNSYKLDVLSIPHVLRMVLKLFPHKYCNHPVLKEKTLRAFVTTIIPGADKEEKFLIKMYEDSYITEDEKDEAWSKMQSIEFDEHIAYMDAPHFVFYVIQNKNTVIVK